MSEFDVLRQDHAVIQLSDESADLLARRMAERFHALDQKLKGGSLGRGGNTGGPNPDTQNQWGGKGVIKFNPTNAEVNSGIRQQQSLLVWQSPDGLPHYVTVEVGRLAGGVGGPGQDGTKGGLIVVNPNTGFGIGSVGGASWPAASDASGNPLYYRGVAQIVLGTPGTMEDQFFIDINRGQRFTALASYVAVTAQMLGPPVDENTGQVGNLNNTLKAGQSPYVSGSLAVYATLGIGVAPSIAPVLYTQYIDIFPSTPLGPGANVFYTRVIPPRANFLFPVLSGNTSNDQIQLQFYDNTGRVIAATGDNFQTTTDGATPFATTAAPLITPIAIPTDCYAVLLDSNVSAAMFQEAFTYRLVYWLSV